MASAMPELGSKISLISKADIRYEGRLFTVDPQECTIALASVRSFGTEDRETQFPVAPQNQVYDYILFRGSDIKDIRVVNNVQSLPNDPAIMQLSVPPSLSAAGPVGPQYGAPQYAHPVVGSNQYPAYHPMAGLPNMRQPMKQPSELSQHVPEMMPAPLAPQPGHIVQVKDQGSMLDLIGGGSNAQNHSRSATPSAPTHRKSPTADQGTQAGPGGGAGAQNREGRRNSNNAQQQRYNQPNQHHSQSNQQQHNQQRNRPTSRNRNQNAQQQQHQGQGQGQGQQQQQQPPHQPPPHQPLQHHNQHPNQHQNQGHQHPNQHQNQGHQHPNQHQNQGQHPMHHQQVYEAGQYRGRGGGAWRGRGGRGGRGGFPHPRNKNTLKFDNDYDFEQANTEFEELRNQLAKAKISDDGKQEVHQRVEGDACSQQGAETEKKDDSGNETGAGEPEVEEDICYDKTKSFFDNISCEAVERSKGRSQRTDWRTERKLNSETFGVASARRGAWRGRGGWRQHPQHQPWRPSGNRGNRGGRGGNNMMMGMPNNNRQRAPGVGAPTTPAPQPLAAAAK